MPINPVVQYQQAFSMALEQRSSGWADIVSDAIPFYDALRRKGKWQTYSGPRIRERLMFSLPEGQWYSDYDILANPPADRFNDAWFTPKQVAVPISLSMREILDNRGANQLKPLMRSYIMAAEQGLKQTMEAALYSDGTGFGGKQLGGLNLILPSKPGNTTGTYGGISRVGLTDWQPSAFDVTTDFAGIGTTFTAATSKAILDKAIGSISRGADGPDLLLADQAYWSAYNQATMSIQRINDENGTGKLGFRSLQYIGPTGTAEVVYGGGRGALIPANTIYGLYMDSFALRYNPDRNFDKLFEGDGAKPINQDAIAQFVGWKGELTNNNPSFSFKLYQS